MRYSKILLVSVPVLLAGCLDIFDNDSDSMYTQPTPPASVSVPPAAGGTGGATPGQTAPTSGTTECGCPGKAPQSGMSIPSDALPPSGALASDADWNPNEGQLVQAGDLVMELQRKNGGVRPSHAAMATHIRTHMGLNTAKAEKVLEEMGL